MSFNHTRIINQSVEFLALVVFSVFANAADTTFPNSVYIKGPGPWFDVKGYGAKGDGVTNDRAAIQSAIDAAGTNVTGTGGANGGGTVFFPPGRYKIQGGPLIDRNSTGTINYYHIELRGAGNGGWGGTSSVGTSSLITDQAINIIDFGLSGSSNPFGPHIRNLGFQDLNGTALAAIKITNSYHIQMEDVACENFAVGKCIFLNAPGLTDVVQYGTFVDIKSRKTKIGFDVNGNSSQFVLLGGHFTAPDTPGSSVGIRIKQPNTCPPSPATCYQHADSMQIINTSLESFETGIELYNADNIRIAARLENFTSLPCWSSATVTCTAISINGSDSTHKSDGNIIMGTLIGTFETGIKLGPNAQRTQIIGNSIISTNPQIVVDPLARDGTIIIGPALTGVGSGTGGARWTTGDGFPPTNNVPVCENGSLYTRTDIGKLYVCEANTWVAK
jgi:Pectate lyase superfamily protein